MRIIHIAILLMFLFTACTTVAIPVSTQIPTLTPLPRTATNKPIPPEASHSALEATKTSENQPDTVVATLGYVPESLIDEVQRIPVASRKVENPNYPWLRDADGIPFTDGMIGDNNTTKSDKDYLAYGLVSGMVYTTIGGKPGVAHLIVDVRVGNTNNFVRFIQPLDVFGPGVVTHADESRPSYFVGNLDELNDKLLANNIWLNDLTPLDEIVNIELIPRKQLRDSARFFL